MRKTQDIQKTFRNHVHLFWYAKPRYSDLMYLLDLHSFSRVAGPQYCRDRTPPGHAELRSGLKPRLSP